MNQLMPWDGDVVRMGWPWHGKIRQIDQNQVGEVLLPNGGTKPVFSWHDIWWMNYTYLFDMGLPDQNDPEVESQGGKWWGRAILRGGGQVSYQLYYGGALVSQNENSFKVGSPFLGVPIWWEDDKEPRKPYYVDIYFEERTWEDRYVFVFRTLAGTVPDVLYYPGIDEIGQGDDQPECASRTRASYDGWALSKSVSLFYFPLLGVYKNKILLGVVVQPKNQEIGISSPPGTSKASGSSPAGAPGGLYGLIEITIAQDIRDQESDHSNTISLRVVEDRRTALGSPVHNVIDQKNPPQDGVTTEYYLDEWIQSSGLVTAWYDAQGNIQTARYNRRHYASREASYGPEVPSRVATERASEIELLDGSGNVVDSFTLKESFEAQELSGLGLQITRTVQVTGEEDDVTTYLDPDHVGGVDVDVPATFPPGLHVANTVVTYQWLVNGENKLRDQDQHQLWIAALSNNSAALCHVREPYDYPEGQDTTTVRVRQGPAVKIDGISPNTIVETITKSKLQHRYLRGFFWTPADGWVRASCNPITGELTRGKECLEYHTSWV
ncbi:hypothetical protein [Pseudomonas aeruginosa]|uniref:hypothetical protein n=1 Tax=Pseudomonas aeruginosa group TaxID=136841 RepID=UPI002109C2CD|nr:hypothetical protein [Pseudomonas aeruginosa]MCT9629149.1 hypothetical protein [Pseudomonas aeruginosa]MCW8036465.1 hypothetical protein [Pseudomonas aeruginosa]UYT22089.1 hypothetical protein OBG92_04284 [Pseudomonas aeruginosa]